MHLIALAPQLLGGGKAGRAGADDADGLIELAQRLRRLDPALREGGLGDVFLDRADGHGIEALLDDAIALAQAALPADAAPPFRRVVRRHPPPPGSPHPPPPSPPTPTPTAFAVLHGATSGTPSHDGPILVLTRRSAVRRPFPSELPPQPPHPPVAAPRVPPSPARGEGRRGASSPSPLAGEGGTRVAGG